MQAATPDHGATSTTDKALEAGYADLMLDQRRAVFPDVAAAMASF